MRKLLKKLILKFGAKNDQSPLGTATYRWLCWDYNTASGIILDNKLLKQAEAIQRKRTYKEISNLYGGEEYAP